MLSQFNYNAIPVQQVLLINLENAIGSLDLKDQSTLNVKDAHAVNVDKMVRRGNDQAINFGDDVNVEDKKEILEDARVGTRSELADHYDKRKQMRKDGKYDKAAEEEWERVRRELKRGAHKSLKEHNKAKLMVLNTPVGDILLI